MAFAMLETGVRQMAVCVAAARQPVFVHGNSNRRGALGVPFFDVHGHCGELSAPGLTVHPGRAPPATYAAVCIAYLCPRSP